MPTRFFYVKRKPKTQNRTKLFYKLTIKYFTSAFNYYSTAFSNNFILSSVVVTLRNLFFET